MMKRLVIVAVCGASLWLAGSAAADVCAGLAFEPICFIQSDLAPAQLTQLAAQAQEDAAYPRGTPPTPLGPGAPVPSDLAPEDPSPVPATGIFVATAAPVAASYFTGQNSWTGISLNALLQPLNLATVYAGASSVDPSVGMVVLVTYDATGTKIQGVLAVTAPVLSGPLTVSTELFNILTLTSTSGHTFLYSPLALTSNVLVQLT